MKYEVSRSKPPPEVAPATNSTPDLRNINTRLF